MTSVDEQQAGTLQLLIEDFLIPAGDRFTNRGIVIDPPFHASDIVASIVRFVGISVPKRD